MMKSVVISILLFVILSTPSTSQTVDIDSLSIGQRFHYETGFDDRGYRSRNPHWGKSVPLFKVFEGVERIPLANNVPGTLSVYDAIRARRSTRRFTRRELPFNHLSTILLSGDGLTLRPSGAIHRTAPSAGALYPIEIYVFVSDVESLEPGFYHFQVRDSTLALLDVDDRSEPLHLAANEQSSVGSSPATLVLTARFDRVTTKYADRGYRYAYIEAGAIAQNIGIQAAALGLGSVVVGSFNDEALSRLLMVDGISEAPILIMPLGFPDD